MTDFIFEQFLKAVTEMQERHKARVCDPEECEKIVNSVGSIFIRDSSGFWWERFRFHPKHYDYPDDSGPAHLLELSPTGDTKCWLLVEPQDTNGRCLAEVSVSGVADILKELPFVEYYVVDQELRWLIAEDHHGRVYVVTGTSHDTGERNVNPHEEHSRGSKGSNGHPRGGSCP